MSNIQVSLFGRLLGTILPDVRSKYLSAGSKNDMSTSVMGLELLSSLRVDFNMNFLPLVELKIAFQWSVEGVKNAFAYFDSVNNFVGSSNSREGQGSIVVLLTT